MILWAGNRQAVLRNNNLAEWNRKFQSHQSCKPKRTTFTGDPKYFHRTEPKETISFNFKQTFPEMLVEWIVHLIFHYKSCVLIGWYINTRYLSAHTLQAEATFSLCEPVCEKYSLPTTIQTHPEIWKNKLKKQAFSCSWPVWSTVWVLHSSCVADQSWWYFFIPSKLAPFDDTPDD